MLRIERLSKTYPNGVKALQEVTLDVPRGMFGLVGPNGAGKSSLMRTVATLQEPDSGAISLLVSNGAGADETIDVLKDKERTRQVLGYLPQEFGVYPKVSAEDLLDHFAVLKGITARGERRDVVAALLRQTNLWEARGRKLGTFSGGMRQRFGIAQALLGDPQLIIVDEPTAGLDPEERNRFLNLLAEIGENVVVILSTHIVADVSDLCSHMAILAGGRVRVSGEPKAVVEALAGRVWKRTVPKAEVAGYAQRLPVLSTRLFGGQTILHVYSEEPLEAGFTPVEPDLEDAYFRHLRGVNGEAAA